MENKFNKEMIKPSVEEKDIIGKKNAVIIQFFTHSFPPKFLYTKVLTYPEIILNIIQQIQI